MVNALMLGESNASIIYGGFLALCYLTPLLGGFIADKYLRKQILYYARWYFNGNWATFVVL
jgi:dipeptide/tripeptide permease